MADQEAAASTPSHLEPSRLGTKTYWDELYTAELSNHAENPEDEGTVWFDDSDAEAKILTFLGDAEADADLLGQQQEPVHRLDKVTTSFLDLGCGNGSLLFGLRDAGWQGRLLGVDYSHQSVALARQVAEARKCADAEARDGQETDPSRRQDQGVTFLAWDILKGALEGDVLAPGGWDVLLDKGTFDAVSLSDERDGQGRRVCEGYCGRVARLLRPGGFFLVTSCNWTEEELSGWFEHEGDGEVLARVGKVNYETFGFGGLQGQTVSTVCFKRLA